MAKYTGFKKNDQWKLLEPLLPKPKRKPKMNSILLKNRGTLYDPDAVEACMRGVGKLKGL